jgi:hypothetical protein
MSGVFDFSHMRWILISNNDLWLTTSNNLIFMLIFLRCNFWFMMWNISFFKFEIDWFQKDMGSCYDCTYMLSPEMLQKILSSPRALNRLVVFLKHSSKQAICSFFQWILSFHEGSIQQMSMWGFKGICNWKRKISYHLVDIFERVWQIPIFFG